MNLFDAKSIIADLGLAGVLGILFTETGLLVGLLFPGDSLLFLAGVAASGTAAALIGVHLSVAGLFIGAPIATIVGSQLGYFIGQRFGRPFFDRPDGRYFNHTRVAATEKWLKKYGPGRAIILARYVVFFTLHCRIEMEGVRSRFHRRVLELSLCQVLLYSLDRVHDCALQLKPL